MEKAKKENSEKPLLINVNLQLIRSLANLDFDFNSFQKDFKKSEEAPSLTKKFPEIKITGNYYDLCALVEFLKISREISLEYAKLTQESD